MIKIFKLICCIFPNNPFYIICVTNQYSQYFWPENFRINQLSASLQKKGNKVTVLTGLPNYPEGKIYEDYTKSPHSYNKYDGVEILRVPLLPRGKNKLFLLLNYFSFCLSACTLVIQKFGKKF